MERVFSEMYSEEKHPGVFFWSKIISDTALSGINQHLDSLGEKGFKNYLTDTLYINGFNIAGLILLLPAISMLTIDMVARIIQGDLVHYNRPVYNLVSHTFLYQYPILLTWVFIFPTLALILNLLSLILNLSQKKMRIFSLGFIKRNFFNLLFIGVGFFFLALIYGHDIFPCTVHGIIRFGLNNLINSFNYCRVNA